jgi:hypothetical protein
MPSLVLVLEQLNTGSRKKRFLPSIFVFSAGEFAGKMIRSSSML